VTTIGSIDPGCRNATKKGDGVKGPNGAKEEKGVFH
jgi:hypothetical protein